MNALLLSGGKSSRFGTNKAMETINGRPLIEQIVEGLKNAFEKVYIIGNVKEYVFLQDVFFCEDIIPNKGPLGGLLTGLTCSDSDYNFLTACDMPFLTSEFFEFVNLQKKDYDVLVPEYNSYLEPLAAVYSKKCLPFINASLKNDQLKLKSFFPKVKVRIIKETIIREIGEPEKLFFNINYKEDIEKLEMNLERSEKI
ncbi:MULTISPECIES: molybdenum cofactor guanylyltransferase [unclassified Petrotoga]|jgi:molybdopterin-guanine dinucleotide biosynthesis protein A|uniref:molybdenum cofactor guanylyltransferase n=1 Tax=unclassified Petrotoga TaxID=2620614 RepID=UPI000CA07B10|nr:MULTISPECIES: molybdenum cofactor guanylyltransferase [unclassified Petrotoga]PNR87033.1 Molybdopterin-guanine dinucleotide biosynthesis protein A [Petrotoga sp. 9T1HF07.CasAA.8.2]PNR94217.1 Molybdopterin-guanine dinucleotide biosynthesis protein A [Petrotoga sp. HWHPT.55.6.3]